MPEPLHRTNTKTPRIDTSHPVALARAGSLAFVLLLAASCSQQQEPGSCVSSIVQGPMRPIDHNTQQKAVFDTILKAAPLGGYLDFAESRCTVTIEVVEKTTSEYRLALWTARHCGADVIRDDVQPRLQVFLFDGYRNVALKDDLVSRRRAARAQADKSSLSAEAQQVLAEAFRPDVGIVKNSEDTGCYDSDLATADRKNDRLVVCANMDDLGVYEASVGLAKLDPDVARYLDDAQARAQATKDSLAPTQPMTELTNWSSSVRARWQMQRMKHYADVLHWTTDVCTGNPTQLQQPICKNVSSLIDIADSHLVQQNESVLDRARRLGFWDDASQTLRNVNGQSYGNFLKSEEGKLRQTVQSYWQTRGKDLLLEPNGLWTWTNVIPTEGAPPSFAALPVHRIYAALDQWQQMLKPTGLQISQARSEVSLAFERGDSGTVFAAYGLFPVLALSGVNGEQTSGGVAVLPLPQATGQATVKPSSLATDVGSDQPADDEAQSATKNSIKRGGC